MTAECKRLSPDHGGPTCGCADGVCALGVTAPPQVAGNSPAVQALVNTVRDMMGKGSLAYEGSPIPMEQWFSYRERAYAALDALVARVEELQRQLAEAGGSAPMTDSQAAYLQSLAQRAEAAEARIADADDRAYKADCFAIDARMERDRLKDALERIGWHELTWKEARDVARAALAREDTA